MNKETREYAANVLKEIKASVHADVIKDSHISKFCDVETKREVGFVVYMTLSDKFDYTSWLLEKWRKRFAADAYVISVMQNTLRIRFHVMYSEDMQEP